MKDILETILGIILFIAICLFIPKACDKETNTNTNLTFKKSTINVCNEEIELYDFIEDEEFDITSFEEYLNEICVKKEIEE